MRFAERSILPHSYADLVAVMLGLIRSFDRHAEILGLLVGKDSEFNADFLQVQARDFFIELFAQDIDTYFVSVLVLPEVELREHLV